MKRCTRCNFPKFAHTVPAFTRAFCDKFDPPPSWWTRRFTSRRTG